MIAVMANEINKLILTRIVNEQRVCGLQKIEQNYMQGPFFPFIDQMLDRLVRKSHYCFVDGYLGYNQIIISLEDQEKTTLTCPYGILAFRRMPFRLCNAPGKF